MRHCLIVDRIRENGITAWYRKGIVVNVTGSAGLIVNAYDESIVCLIPPDTSYVEPVKHHLAEFALDFGVEITDLEHVLVELLTAAVHYADTCHTPSSVLCSLRRVNGVLFQITVQHGRSYRSSEQENGGEGIDQECPWQNVRRLVEKAGTQTQFHEDANRVAIYLMAKPR